MGRNWAFSKWAYGEWFQNKTRSRLRLQIPFCRVIGLLEPVPPHRSVTLRLDKTDTYMYVFYEPQYHAPGCQLSVDVRGGVLDVVQMP